MNKQYGFSLLEVLIAFTILAFSLTILLNIFSTNLNSAAVSEEYTTAVQLAEAFMARAGVASGIPLRSDGGRCADAVKRTPGDSFSTDKYSCKFSIEAFGLIYGKFKTESPKAELYRVDVTVSWDGGGDNQRQVELSRIKLLGKDVLQQ